MPCLAHNIRLVIKDGLTLDNDYDKLLKHLSEDIVNKSKKSLVTAEEMRKLNIKLNKKNVTHWNSILFMTRSVLRLSAADFKTIRSEIPAQTKAQQETREKFDLSKKERDMLVELVNILEAFEFFTDELQGNSVNISRVYPGVIFLRDKLKLDGAIYTIELRKNLLESLNKRFSDILDDDVIVFSTVLDPNFGLRFIDKRKQQEVKARLCASLKKESASQQVTIYRITLYLK